MSPCTCAHTRVHVRACVRLEGAAESQQPKVEGIAREARLHSGASCSRRFITMVAATSQPGSASPSPAWPWVPRLVPGASRQIQSRLPTRVLTGGRLGARASLAALLGSRRPGAVLLGLCVQTVVCDYAKQRQETKLYLALGSSKMLPRKCCFYYFF